MFETPHYVSELYMKKEDLRILRENVLLVVRDYNRLVLKQYMSWHRLLRKKKQKKMFESRSNIRIITASMSVNQLKALEGKPSKCAELVSFHHTDKILIGLSSYQTKWNWANRKMLTYFVITWSTESLLFCHLKNVDCSGRESDHWTRKFILVWLSLLGHLKESQITSLESAEITVVR